jgi:hypothetical protein
VDRVTIVASHLISVRFCWRQAYLVTSKTRSTASSEGDAAVFIDRETSRRAPAGPAVQALNDNEPAGHAPSLAELFYLRRGVSQAGGKLPLFDLDGQAVAVAIVRRCLDQGWAEPWFNNPLKPDWLVCKLTPAGRRLATAS